MERKIGEIFEYNSEWYQCIKGDCCRNCDFYDKFKDDICFSINNCSLSHRSDKTSVIFKKLEKVGEPYQYIDGIYQEYKATLPFFIRDATYIGTVNGFAIKIKQNREDMEEKKQKIDNLVGLYSSGKITYKELDKELKALYDKEESNEPTLKEFDLEAAKAGKPVYTRDGRLVRIICFDAKRKDEKSIIVLVPSKDYPGFEDLIAYPNNGNYHGGHENDGDLMMYPEKKEGWAVIRKGDIYETEELAKKELLESHTATMIRKIEWEE